MFHRSIKWFLRKLVELADNEIVSWYHTHDVSYVLSRHQNTVKTSGIHRRHDKNK